MIPRMARVPALLSLCRGAALFDLVKADAHGADYLASPKESISTAWPCSESCSTVETRKASLLEFYLTLQNLFRRAGQNILYR